MEKKTLRKIASPIVFIFWFAAINGFCISYLAFIYGLFRLTTRFFYEENEDTVMQNVACIFGFIVFPFYVTKHFINDTL